MKTTLHILLELDVDPATLQADDAAREAAALAQAAALRVSAVCPVVNYSVAMVPVSRAALHSTLELAAKAVGA